jgi:putative ABC transport system permease protein
MVPADLHLGLTPAAVPVGCVFMLAVAVTGTWSAARRSARLAPAEALLEADVDRRAMTVTRWLLGLSCLALAGYVMSRTARGGADGQLAVAFVDAVLVGIGLTMLAPLIIPRVTALSLLPACVLGAGRVAGRSSHRAARRTAALATPVLLVVAITAALGTVIDSVQATVHVHVADPTDSSNMNPAFLAMVVAVMVSYASVSLAGLAALATGARGRELIALRFAGATRAQTMTVVALETLVATIVGAALGIGSVMVGSLGAHTTGDVVVPWTLLIAVSAICAAVPTIASIVVTATGPAGADALTAAGGT